MKLYIKTSRARFFGVRKELRILFLLSITSILSIELILKDIQVVYQYQYEIGVIYLKICYSFLASFLFYYLVVHLPKERKRVKGFRFIASKIVSINFTINDVILKTYRITNPTIRYVSYPINQEDITEKCKILNPSLPIKFFDTEMQIPVILTTQFQFKVTT